MGNPLLDISATVSPDLLAKYELKANDAILTEEEAIFKDLTEGYKVIIYQKTSEIINKVQILLSCMIPPGAIRVLTPKF
jgi:hypothetical protein